MRGPILGLGSTPLLSLHDAIRDIRFDDKELFLETAAVYLPNDRYPLSGCTSSVSGDEAKAVFLYTCEMPKRENSVYHCLNECLRGRDRSKIVPYLPYMKLLVSGLSKLQRPMHRNLWRGVSKDLYDVYIKQIDQTIVFWGFTSTTTDMSALKHFMPDGGTIFCIRVKYASSIQDFSSFREEAEVLIAAGTVFRILNVYKASNTTMVELLEEKNLLGISPPQDALYPSASFSKLSNQEPTTQCSIAAVGQPPEGPQCAPVAVAPPIMIPSASKSDCPASPPVLKAPPLPHSGQVSPVELFLEGQHHEIGHGGTPPDDFRARQLYEQAAALPGGHAGAESRLGAFYEAGRGGLLKSGAEAMRLYRLAAEKGDAAAQCALGVCYFRGVGGTRDDSEALRWFQLAAKQGHASGQFHLGYWYDEGKGGLDKDRGRAVALYKAAAAQGDGMALVAIKEMTPPCGCGVM